MLIFTAEQIHCIEDATAIRGISRLRLMENAGSAAARVIRERYDVKNKKITVICGNGNNGGDGFVIARKLSESGAQVCAVRLMGLPITENAEIMCRKLIESGVKIYDYFDNTDYVRTLLKSSEIVIDAVFGIGLNRGIDTAVSSVLTYLSNLNAVRIAVDIPSGLYCDTARCATGHFKADLTISFIGYKPCHLLPPASSHCGEVVNCAIGVPDDVLDTYSSCPQVIDEVKLVKRDKNAHKGDFGTALLICGSYGMAGAAAIAARATLRCGVGIAKLAVPEKIYSVLAAKLDEPVFIPVDTGTANTFTANSYSYLCDDIAAADAILFGCGVGRGSDVISFLRDLLLNAECNVVIDADGINALARNIDIIKQSKCGVIITPHAGEMARLCRVAVEEIQSDRIGYAKKISTEYGVTVVLKGANTVIALKDGRVFINTTGNPGMATGGSGDMLAGMITSFLAQGISIETAVCNAVYIHGLAGDLAASKLSQTAVIPNDMISQLPELFKKFER